MRGCRAVECAYGILPLRARGLTRFNQRKKTTKSKEHWICPGRGELGLCLGVQGGLRLGGEEAGPGEEVQSPPAFPALSGG